MKIFLVGFMGSGKTTIGKKLANYLDFKFIDLDKLIEDKAGMSISEYFSRFGEDAFRVMEGQVLRESVYPENSVIAAGGGTPCFHDNMRWMNENGKVVYLSLPPKALASRLEHSTTERPLIKHLRGDELVSFIAKKLREREPFYNQAKFIAEGTGLTAEALAALVGAGEPHQD